MNCREVFSRFKKGVEGEDMKDRIEKMGMQLERVLETCAVEYSNDIAKGVHMQYDR
jgi:predicted hydrolase (HD superfamily)